MRILTSLKNILVGYCIGFTAAYYVCIWTGAQMLELRYQFLNLISLVSSWLLIDAMKTSNKKGKHDHQKNKLVLKKDDEDQNQA